MSTSPQLQSIIDSIAYVNKFHGNTFLIKLGGSILNDEALIAALCSDLKLLKRAGIKIIIVHGGSQAIKHYLSAHNIDSHFVDGLRVTSQEAMKVIEMVLCGHVNKLLVRRLNHIGINAIGLSGTDNNMLQCHYHSQEHGFVGKVHTVNPKPIFHWMHQNDIGIDTIPIIAPVGIDHAGNPMNINADEAAAHIAAAMSVNKLIYLTDQDGIYDSNKNAYSELSLADLSHLVDKKIVKDGMLAKVNAIIKALKNHLSQVHILNGKREHVLIEELFTINGAGTLCNNSTTLTLKEEVIA